MNFDAKDFLTVVGDAVLAVDREGKIQFWNSAAARMFGFDAAEAIGTSLDAIIPERYRARHWEAYFRVMETGLTKLGGDLLHVTARRKTGEEFRAALTVGILRAQDESIAYIGAILRESTDPPRRGPAPS